VSFIEFVYLKQINNNLARIVDNYVSTVYKGHTVNLSFRDIFSKKVL
jgi:hypothetical protein